MNPETNSAIGRRTFLKGAAGAAAIATTTTAASLPAAAQSPFDGWFDDVGNYDGVVDETGKSEVTVEVGAQGNGGGFAFGPAAIRVDPGTTVVWEWTGDGGSHNVAAENGDFESEMTDEAGHTFEHTFEEEGITKYACTPHKAMGMKGAIVVGDVEVASPSSSESDESGSAGDLAGWFEGVDNYDGVVDRTGESEVTVEVGAQGNGGGFAFGPAAVRVDPGTTVVWEWTGDGGSHNVVAEDGSFESETTDEAGHTFEHTFDEEGVTKYACTPHKAMGMKGAIVVGDEAAASADTAAATASGGLSDTDYLTLGFGVALVAALFGLPVADARRKQNRS